MALDVLQWTKESREDVNFVMEGKLLFTPSTEVNWKRAWTVKMTPVSALLVTLGHNTLDPPALMTSSHSLMTSSSTSFSPTSSSVTTRGGGGGAPACVTDPSVGGGLQFPVDTGVREAALLLIREKNNRYTMIRVSVCNLYFHRFSDP